MSPATKAKQAEILKNFDNLPDCAFVQIPTVCGLYGCSAATIWRRVKNGAVPAPRKLTAGHTAWNVGQLRADLNGGVQA